MANFWPLERVLQSWIPIAVPAEALPLRTFMQRLVLPDFTKKLPVATSGEMFQACCALPLQVCSVTPVPLVPAPASRQTLALLMGEMLQFEPLGAMLNTEVTRPAEAFHCWSGEVP